MTEIFPLNITPSDLEGFFGRAVNIASSLLLGMEYREATAGEIAEIEARLTDILNDAQIGASTLDRWEQGWAEVRATVTRDGVSESTLAPQYFRHRTMRFRGRYIQARSSSFEPKVYKAVKTAIFDRYLQDATRIVEFGCGTGLNLYQIHRQFPKAALVGCDWARPSQEILSLIADATGTDLVGLHFDMRTLDGRESVKLDGSTTVLTLHAMEQLGSGYEAFLDYLVAAKPQVVIHLEPIVELYDPATPFDAAAIAYHRKRGYLEGFLPALQARDDVEILECRRLGFGSTFHEAYTLIAWRPR